MESAKKSVKGVHLQASDFVHLHNHTHYSLLDGLQKIKPMLENTKAMGMESIAVTDHGTLSGAIEFYEAANEQGIKPIVGMEAYVASRKYADKDPGKDKLYYHLILLAMNQTGYKNLMRLSTLANLDGFYYKPRIDHDLLEQYNEGLIVLSGCIGGEVGDKLRQDQYEQAKTVAEWYKKIFKDRYYLELQDHGHEKHSSVWKEQTSVNKQLLKLAKELDLPCVITCDAHYLKHEDQEAHEVLLCVQTGAFLSDTSRMSLKDFELHVTDPLEIIDRWGKDHPDLITNTKAIANRCDLTLELGKILIPKFPTPKGETENSLLEKMVYRGLAWRYGGVGEEAARALSIAAAKKTLSTEVKERAQYELGVVESMGFNGYFLIIADFVNWGKDQGIVFGPGRGSAAGSIISYALKITELDPLAYGLLFERFLNPDRISMPDIDIDIQDSRRDEVIQYCVEKYGKERVANIVTFGTMAARNAVRDVARVLQVPYAEADRLAKMIPPPVQGRHIPLEKSLASNQDLKREYEASEQAQRVFDLAVRLEGTIRSHGVHAAGVVIAPDDIVNFAPLEMAQKGVVATQYSMGPIEHIGLLKMDFLGLSNLTIIKNALRIIRRVYGEDVDINTIPLDDANTFALLQRGETTGVFQLESAGMKRYLRQLKPTLFEDIVSMVALYRPGPMQWIDDFIARKHGEKAITYLHPAMEPALKDTYGVIVTQEQVMQISKDMCGFSGGQADALRKAIGKKIPEAMKKLKTEFIEGAIKTVDADPAMMEKFWGQLEEFAAYCFNKAHSACYAMIAYQTAYLKANYPAAFMAALMTSDFDDTDRLAIEIAECKSKGIEVLPPDVNESFLEFAIVPEGENRLASIRFGMAAVKNVGTAAVEEILRARELDGGFSDLEDFFKKVNTHTVNRKSIESLIKSGAFDRFGDRGVLLTNIDVLLAFASREQRDIASGQTDIFGSTGVKSVTNITPRITLASAGVNFETRDFLTWERELLGIYLSEHPLAAYESYLAEQTMPLNKLIPEMDSKRAVVGGNIVTKREITTKNGQTMAFVKLADRYGEIELILFPGVYQTNPSLWEQDRIVIVKGKISSKDKSGTATTEIKLLVSEAEELLLETIESTYKPTGKKLNLPKSSGLSESKKSSKTGTGEDKKIFVRLASAQDQTLLSQLKHILDSHQGSNEIVLVVGESRSKQIIRLPSRIKPDEGCLDELGKLVGVENVKMQ